MPEGLPHSQLVERVARVEEQYDAHEQRLDAAERAQLRLQHDIESTRDMLLHRVERLEDSLGGKVDELRKTMDTKMDSMWASFSQALEATKHMISPWFAIGLAAFTTLAGILLTFKLVRP